jgi:signal transduction histidine kinase
MRCAKREIATSGSNRKCASARDELQRADANKSRFLAVLSHELRNPMAPLLNGLTLLDMQPHLSDAGRTRAMMGRQIDHLRA